MNACICGHPDEAPLTKGQQAYLRRKTKRYRIVICSICGHEVKPPRWTAECTM